MGGAGKMLHLFCDDVKEEFVLYDVCGGGVTR